MKNKTKACPMAGVRPWKGPSASRVKKSLERLVAAGASENELAVFPLLADTYGIRVADWLAARAFGKANRDRREARHATGESAKKE